MLAGNGSFRIESGVVWCVGLVFSVPATRSARARFVSRPGASLRVIFFVGNNGKENENFRILLKVMRLIHKVFTSASLGLPC